MIDVDTLNLKQLFKKFSPVIIFFPSPPSFPEVMKVKFPLGWVDKHMRRPKLETTPVIASM